MAAVAPTLVRGEWTAWAWGTLEVGGWKAPSSMRSAAAPMAPSAGSGPGVRTQLGTALQSVAASPSPPGRALPLPAPLPPAPRQNWRYTRSGFSHVAASVTAIALKEKYTGCPGFPPRNPRKPGIPGHIGIPGEIYPGFYDSGSRLIQINTGVVAIRSVHGGQPGIFRKWGLGPGLSLPHLAVAAHSLASNPWQWPQTQVGRYSSSFVSATCSPSTAFPPPPPPTGTVRAAKSERHTPADIAMHSASGGGFQTQNTLVCSHRKHDAYGGRSASPTKRHR